MLLLGACGPVPDPFAPPRPFQPAAKGDNALLLLPDRTGITVSAVGGDAPGNAGTGTIRDGALLAEALAAALRKQNIPAEVAHGNRMSRWLLGNARLAEPAPDGTARLTLTWELYEPDGARIGTRTQEVRIDPARWRAGDTALLDRLAHSAAPRIAGLIQAPAPQQTRLRGYPPGTRLVVGRIAGEPGAGARALAGAMARTLRNRALPLADQAQPGDVVVTGDLTLGPASGGTRPLEVVWRLHRAGADGDRDLLGDLRQANRVPERQIERGWNALSGLIARAATPGVLEILKARAPNTNGGNGGTNGAAPE